MILLWSQRRIPIQDPALEIRKSKSPEELRSPSPQFLKGNWPPRGYAARIGRALQRPPESGGQRGPRGSRERRFLSKPCQHAALEPPLARSRLRLDRAALLTQEGNAPSLTHFMQTGQDGPI